MASYKGHLSSPCSSGLPFFLLPGSVLEVLSGFVLEVHPDSVLKVPPGSVLALSKATLKLSLWDFPGGAVVKNPPANAGLVQALVRKDPTCRGATKPMRHNY